MNCPYTAVKNFLRPGLPPITERLAKLPIDDRGYPVPFFVAYVDGKPEFRIADREKYLLCRAQKLCWVCGQKLAGERKAFVIGPMCAINRVSSEPPSHHECAEWSVKGCPFLNRPNMERRKHDEILAMGGTAAGEMIERNPGVSLIWETNDWKWFADGSGGVLIKVGDPLSVSYWREGRTATRAEIMESINTGIPLLRGACDGDATHLANLRRAINKAVELVPAI